MARSHTEPLDLEKMVHISWLAVMRAQLRAYEEGRLGASTDLENIATELHRVHGSLLKGRGSLRTRLTLVESPSAQMRIEDLL